MQEEIEVQQTATENVEATTTEELVAAITLAVSRLQWSADELREHRTQALRRTLALARDRSPFYAERLAGVDVERATEADLVNIEPTTKHDLIDQLERVSTRPGLRDADLEDHVANLTEPKPFEDFYVFGSSGSSGRRALSPMLRTDMVRNCAMLIACQAGQQRITTEERPACTFVIAGSHPSHLGSATAQVYRLLGPIGATEAVPASAPIEAIVERARSADPTAIMGFPSVISRLARVQLRGKVSLRPELVVSIGEPLSAADADTMSEAWGCPIHSAYGCSELGWLSVTTGPGGPMIAMDDQFVIEPLDAGRNPVAHGEESASVCFTTLDRTEFPLIRYELADRIRTLPADPDGSNAFSRIETVLGRDDDWFRYGGIEIHPATFRGELIKHKQVDEYQVVQTARGARILAVVNQPAPDPAEIATAVRDALGGAGLASAEVEVEFVEALDRHAGQKLMRFVALPASDQPPT